MMKPVELISVVLFVVFRIACLGVQCKPNSEPLESPVQCLVEPDPIEQIAPSLNVFSHRAGVANVTLEYGSPGGMDKFIKDHADLWDVERVVLITHGFWNDRNTPWLFDMKNALVNWSRANDHPQTIVIVGWGKGASLSLLHFEQAGVNAEPVGIYVGQFVKAIKAVQPEVHIYGIGHSFGSHLMGFAGRTSQLFDRITGLDPAGPCYEQVPNSKSLSASDARLVDTIHTDGAYDVFDLASQPKEQEEDTRGFFVNIWNGIKNASWNLWNEFEEGMASLRDIISKVRHFGSLTPIGTYDFYPNYGYHQPTKSYIPGYSHTVAKDYFIWSILNPGKLMATHVLAEKPVMGKTVRKTVQIDKLVEMGYHFDESKAQRLDKSKRNLFFLKTHYCAPWV